MDLKIDLIFGCYHSDHPPNLTIIENNQRRCVACMLDLCADISQPSVKKHYFMNNLLEIFKSNRSNILPTLQMSPHETAHIITVFLNLINHEDTYLSNLSSEGICLILSSVKQSDLVEVVLNRICIRLAANYHFQHYLPFVNLAANLLNKFPFLVPDFVSKCGSHFGSISSGLRYPNEGVRTGVLCFFTQICRRDLGLLGGDVKFLLLEGVVRILKEEESGSLLRSALALIKILIKEEDQFLQLFQMNFEGATFPLLVKKTLLRRDMQLQIECCQTLLLAMSQQTFDTRKADLIMQCDVAEILFETLATQNINLIELVFSCISKFCHHSNFFVNCHVVFGIDPIFRCIEQLFDANSIAVLPIGLTLLKDIFSKNLSEVTLFSNSHSVQKTISVLSRGINSCYRNISLEATRAFQFFLRREYMHLPIPFLDIQNVISDLSKNVPDLFTSSSINKGFCPEIELPEQLLIAKLSVTNAAISLLQECISDPSCFEGSFKPPQEIFGKNSETEDRSCQVNQFIGSILELLYDFYIPVLFKYSGGLKSLRSCVVVVECLIKLEELSPKEMQEYFISLCKLDFIKWLWDLRRYQRIEKDEDVYELKKNCDHLLSIMLKNLTYNFDEMEGVVPFFDLSSLNGNLNECTSNLLNFHNSLWAADNKLTVVHSTILAILYFNKLHSNWDVIKPIDLLEILSNFIQNCPNLEHIPHFTHKHLLFLFALACEETNTDDTHKNRLVKPVIDIFSQLFQSYFLPLNVLCTHHESLLKWTFTDPKMATILGAPLLCQWLKRVENSAECELSTLKTLLVCQNGFVVSIFLDLFNSFDFSAPVWSMLGDLISNMDADLRCKTRSSVVRKFCEICGDANGRKMNEITENILSIILKLLARLDATDVELSQLRISKNVCSILPDITSCDLIMMSYHYLNNVLTLCCENGDNKVLTMILSQRKLMEHVHQISFKPENSVQPLALNLLAHVIRYQFKFKNQISSALKFDFKQLQTILASQCVEVLQSGVIFTHSILETSFKSAVLNTQSLLDDRNHYNSLRLLHIYLQNIAFKVDGVIKETVLECIIYLLTFAHTYNADLGTHLMCQLSFGVLFESHLGSFMRAQNVKLKRLLYLFLEFPVVNKAVLGFIFKLLHQLMNSSSSVEKDSIIELFEKLSRSSYYENVKPQIEDYIRSIAVEE